MDRALPVFVISGPPRTKKTSNRIISIPKANSRKCRLCGHRPGFPKILPSEAHEEWFAAALPQAHFIRAKLAARGFEMPIVSGVNVRALFFRERASGDSSGFYQALGDLLEAANIIRNDEQIESWDGSLRLKDAARPRIEVELTIVAERAVNQELFTGARSAC